MGRNNELRLIAILRQFFNEQYARKQQCFKSSTLPHYSSLYSNKISEVAETTQAYSVDMVRSFNVGKKVLKLSKKKYPKLRAQRKTKQIHLILQVKRRVICFKDRLLVLTACMKSLFSSSVVCRDLAN